MNEIFIAVEHGRYQCFRHVGDRHRLGIGPAFRTPREAIDYANSVDAPATRPADVPDLAGGFWGAAESRDEARRPSGSPDSFPPDGDGTPSRSVTPAGSG